MFYGLEEERTRFRKKKEKKKKRKALSRLQVGGRFEMVFKDI